MRQKRTSSRALIDLCVWFTPVQTNYDAVATSGDFSLTTEDKCEALVTFSKCLSNFPRSKLMESDLFLKVPYVGVMQCK